MVSREDRCQQFCFTVKERRHFEKFQVFSGFIVNQEQEQDSHLGILSDSRGPAFSISGKVSVINMKLNKCVKMAQLRYVYLHMCLCMWMYRKRIRRKYYTVKMLNSHQILGRKFLCQIQPNCQTEEKLKPEMHSSVTMSKRDLTKRQNVPVHVLCADLPRNELEKNITFLSISPNSTKKYLEKCKTISAKDT